jgi:hypothetical protein
MIMIKTHQNCQQEYIVKDISTFLDFLKKVKGDLVNRGAQSESKTHLE